MKLTFVIKYNTMDVYSWEGRSAYATLCVCALIVDQQGELKTLDQKE